MPWGRRPWGERCSEGERRQGTIKRRMQYFKKELAGAGYWPRRAAGRLGDQRRRWRGGRRKAPAVPSAVNREGKWRVGRE